MKVIDSEPKEQQSFSNLSIGDVFVCRGTVYIKYDCCYGLDVVRQLSVNFQPRELVEHREATLVLTRRGKQEE
jgi:hypothetical protein